MRSESEYLFFLLCIRADAPREQLEGHPHDAAQAALLLMLPLLRALRTHPAEKASNAMRPAPPSTVALVVVVKADLVSMTVARDVNRPDEQKPTHQLQCMRHLG